MLKKYMFIRRVRPLAATTLQKSHGRGNAEPLANNASKPMGKILGGGKILPKRKNKKNQRCQGAENQISFTSSNSSGLSKSAGRTFSWGLLKR
jgi:hypothetical protein